MNSSQEKTPVQSALSVPLKGHITDLCFSSTNDHVYIAYTNGALEVRDTKVSIFASIVIRLQSDLP